jgi:hypothetical protein
MVAYEADALANALNQAIERAVAARQPAAPSNQITFEDYLGLQHALFEWADSYDAKDWNRLSKVIAPTLRVS